uniref:Uncharacterized protein n=1 Tax=Timema bartmani TaxID=61472 RepID=A0A7R9EVV1_9NEOP|nr:unnamed protein product [Timema bartmani]
MVTCQQSKDEDAGDNGSYSSATAGVDLGSDWEDVSDTTSVFEDDDNDVHKEARVRSPTNTDEDIAEAVNIRRKRFETRPSYGNIAVNRSTDIHFGNKTYYNAPVTIKQYVNSNGGESGVYPGGASGPQDVSHRTDGGTADLHTKLHTEINLMSARRHSKDSCKHRLLTIYLCEWGYITYIITIVILTRLETNLDHPDVMVPVTISKTISALQIKAILTSTFQLFLGHLIPQPVKHSSVVMC